MPKEKTQRFCSHLWHFYQPPWQSDYWIDKISKECFGWLSEWLASQDSSMFKVNVNICASLTERLQKQGFTKILDNFAIAAEKGVIEFVDSAAYHAPLTCLPDSIRNEATLRQIEKNRKINSSYFGNHWQTKGFFPPEMMFSPELAQILKSEGFSWTITDDAVFNAGNLNSGSIPHDAVATVNGLPVFFRSGDWSNKFSMKYPHEVRSSCNGDKDSLADSLTLARRFASDMAAGISSWFEKGYAILAYDGETIGHHQKIYNRDVMDEYVMLLNKNELIPAHISSLLDQFPQRVAIEPSINNPLKGSWSTELQEIKSGNYYPLWKNPSNPIHAAYWNLLEAAVSQGLDDRLDKALNSCPLWWANPGTLRGGNHLEFVKIGADELYKITNGSAKKQYDDLIGILLKK